MNLDLPEIFIKIKQKYIWNNTIYYFQLPIPINSDFCVPQFFLLVV